MKHTCINQMYKISKTKTLDKPYKNIKILGTRDNFPQDIPSVHHRAKHKDIICLLVCTNVNYISRSQAQ